MKKAENGKPRKLLEVRLDLLQFINRITSSSADRSEEGDGVFDISDNGSEEGGYSLLQN